MLSLTGAPSARPLRFGVVSGPMLGDRGWLDRVRRVEDAGVSTLLVRDHFIAEAYGAQFAPFSALAAAAAASSRLHVGTMVLSNDYRHPALVAHEAATIQALSGGRFELGLGAGWYEPEYRRAGMSFDPPGQRIGRLEESLAIITRLLAGEEVHHAGAFYHIDGLSLVGLMDLPLQPRLLVGAGGPRMLGVAARYADIVGVLPAPIRGADDIEDPRDRRPAAFDAKIRTLQSDAGDRFPEIEISAFVTIRLTGSRRSSTEELISQLGWTGIDVADVWEMPTVLIGSAPQIREDIVARRDRYHLSYLVCSDEYLPAVTEIIAGL
ncbi:MAG TPA: TIGR03621 family F420-dependent LLM class oxidoreductase [Acidimicrobiales bacterium]|nr:TIGR03621 family F420-dependent LLM class oxidoreductase [Acidimicrobiales bacterium]